MEMTLDFIDDRMIANLPQGPLAIGHASDTHNPGELILAAVVGCSSAVLKQILEKRQIKYVELTVRASMTEDNSRQTVRIKTIHIQFLITEPSVDQVKLNKALERAVAHCPIVQSLKTAIQIRETIIRL